MADNGKINIQLEPEHADQLVAMLTGVPPPPPGTPMPPPAVRTSTGPALGLVPQPAAVEAAKASMPTLEQAPITTPASFGTAPRSTLGKIGHALGVVGQVAGSEFAPHAMPWIPGTAQYKERQAEDQAALQGKQAETGLKGAQSDYYESEAWKATHPAEKEATEDWHPVTGTNWELNYKSGETRQMQGVPEPKEKTTGAKGMFFMPPGASPDKPVEPVQGYEMNGKYYLSNNEPLPQGYAPFKPSTGDRMTPIEGAMLVRSMMGHGYADSPGILKAAADIAKASGLPFTPEDLKAIAAIPPGWQYGAGGEALGYHSPLFAKGQTVQRMQFSRELIPTIDESMTTIAQDPKLFGVIKGRANQILSGDLGSANAPYYAQLMNLHNIATAWMRLHANSDKAREDFLNLLKSGQAPENLIAGLGSIRRQADIYANYGVAPGDIFGKKAERGAEKSKPTNEELMERLAKKYGGGNAR